MPSLPCTPTLPQLSQPIPKLRKLCHLFPGSLVLAVPRHHRGWGGSNGHRGRSAALRTNTDSGTAVSTTALLHPQLALQMTGHFLGHFILTETFSCIFSGQILLQYYSLPIARNCFLEFLSRRKCVFLRNRCSSLKPNFMWELKNETKIITLKSGSSGATSLPEECFLSGGRR